MIRRAAAADAAPIAAVEEACFGRDAWSLTAVVDELQTATRTVYVAHVEGELIGYASVMTVAPVADVQRIAVQPAWRRKGIGAALLDTLIAGVSPECEQMVLEVAHTNVPAITMYVDRRFVETARRCNYYADGSDAIILQRDLR